MTRAKEEHLSHVVFITAAAAIGGFLFGYDSSVINGAVKGIEGRFDAAGFVTGFVVASALIGSAVGAWFGGGIADRLGRTVAMRIAAAVFAVSSIGQALPFALWDLTVWRVLGGVALGMGSGIGPAELAAVS